MVIAQSIFIIFIAIVMFEGIVVAVVNFKPCISGQVIDSRFHFQDIPKHILIKQAS
ncbi:hypothetical protein D3C71_1983800 [compost metagenome]